MNRLLALVAVALAATACNLKPASTASATQEPAYVFPHTPHLEGEVACSECHAGIETSKALDPKVRHVKLPANPSKVDACSGCHDTDPKITLPVRSREFRVRFSHADHLPKQKNCQACHRVLPEKGDAQAKTPPMEACTACHKHQLDFAQARCTPCHVDLKGYKPETAFAHEGEWLRAHGPLARPSAESCAQCHDQTYCAQCHDPATTAARPSVIFPERVENRFIHRGDYVSRHMVEAGASPASCQKCHGRAFCDTCHQANNFRQGEAGTRNPHDDPNFFAKHGPAARREAGNCATCHERGGQTICVGCHASAGPGAGINPHPGGWASRHDRGDIGKNGMCRTCHANG
jgi:hypothetical protein